VNWASLTGADNVTMWLEGEDSELVGDVGDFKSGFIGGAFLTLFLSDMIGIQTEAMYIQKGGEGPAKGQIIFRPEYGQPQFALFDGTVYAKINYIEVPLLAVFRFDAVDSGNLRIHGLAGPTFALKTDAKGSLEGQGRIKLQDESYRLVDVDQEDDLRNRVKNFEFGILIGAAVYWDIGNVDLVFESRWERGLTTIDNTTLYRDIETSNVCLMFGFSYPFGG